MIKAANRRCDVVKPNADPQFGLGQILQGKGFQLGRDFSYDDNGYAHSASHPNQASKSAAAMGLA